MEHSSFKVGDIVTLNAHPYRQNMTSVVISGDHLTIPPLMIVVEVVNPVGNNNGQGKSSQCKCIWYSNKSCSFEEAWIVNNHLKIIKAVATEISSIIETITNSQLVTLKTHKLELAKRKAATLFDGNALDEKATTTVTPLLTFVCPILQVIEIIEPTSKRTKYKNNERKVPIKLVKCKWHNSLSDKLSEIQLPIEALETIKTTPDELLDGINRVINNKGYYKATIDEQVTIIRPINITSKSGNYLLRFFDYRYNEVMEVAILNCKLNNEIENYYTEFAPRFTDLATANHESISEEIKSAIEKAVAIKQHLRIKYKDINDKITIRTVKDLTFISTEGGKGYLSGYCFLRKENRTFSLDKIQHMQLLDL